MTPTPQDHKVVYNDLALKNMHYTLLIGQTKLVGTGVIGWEQKLRGTFFSMGTRQEIQINTKVNDGCNCAAEDCGCIYWGQSHLPQEYTQLLWKHYQMLCKDLPQLLPQESKTLKTSHISKECNHYLFYWANFSLQPPSQYPVSISSQSSAAKVFWLRRGSMVGRCHPQGIVVLNIRHEPIIWFVTSEPVLSSG